MTFLVTCGPNWCHHCVATVMQDTSPPPPASPPTFVHSCGAEYVCVAFGDAVFALAALRIARKTQRHRLQHRWWERAPRDSSEQFKISTFEFCVVLFMARRLQLLVLIVPCTDSACRNYDPTA